MPLPAPDAESSFIRSYHERSKHRFAAYAAGPGSLDWDAQPAPFRHYAGAPTVPLPLADALAAGDPLCRALAVPFADIFGRRRPQAPAADSVGLLLQLSLGLTAWKSLGPDRWAVRANPSSGNLHPVEAWVIARAVPGLPDGVLHYRPEMHALECRALDPAALPGEAPRLQVALSTAMWREAWKYGERGFRYCQLDVGHAIGALRHVAALLGWSLAEVRAVGSETLARRLGLDRAADYPARRDPETESEEPEILLALGCDGAPPALPGPTALAPAPSVRWYGPASPIDSRPMYRWPVVSKAAAATRRSDDCPVLGSEEGLAPPFASAPPIGRAAAEVILARRSAQRFAPDHVMTLDDLAAVLVALVPHAGAPWDALASPARLVPMLFVHRVEAVAPGLYLFTRGSPDGVALADRLGQRFDPEPVAGLPQGLDLRLLAPVAPVELRRLARSLHCHQDIAATACVALGLIAPLAEALAVDPVAYRDLHREAGLIGQVLYLQAEARGLRGTGIGCFFDDPVHALLGLEDGAWQSLYHFTIGKPVEDARIEAAPPYPDRQIPGTPSS